MELARGRKVVLQSEAREEGHLRGNLVGSDRNDPAATERDERESDGIVARQYQEIVGDGVENGSHLGDVPRGFLDSGDVLEAGEALHGGGFDIHAGASLNAIENDGEGNGGGQRFVVLVKAFLR